MKGLISQYFSFCDKKFCTHFEQNVTALMRAGSANTYDISRQLCEMNQKSFKTNEMALYRFLQNKTFQIDDSLWRHHNKLIFDILKERKIISEGDKIQVNVDFTTNENYFLILSASIMLYEKAITIYFTMRKYPKKSNQMSYQKMEQAFIKGLRHILSKKYQYIIVADRGFGNQRFAKLCKDNDFDYVLRINSSLIIKRDGIKSNLNQYLANNKMTAYVLSWKENYHFTIQTKGNKTWYIISSDNTLDAAAIYEKRFKIEKNYQDCKSSGYNIEKNKIRKYDRFKRLLYIVVLSHCLTSIIGSIINYTNNNIKKNSTEQENLSLRLILVFSKLDILLFPYILSNPLLSLQNLYN